MSTNFFQKRNESDIFFIKENIHHFEVYKPFKDYYNPIHNKEDHIKQFINKPNHSNKENIQNNNGDKINNKEKKEFLNRSSSDIFFTKPPKYPGKSLSLPKNHHLNKSQIFPDNYDDEDYIVKFDKTVTPITKFKGEESAYQRKMEDLYGKNSDKLSLIDFSHKSSTKDQLSHEIKFYAPTQKKTINEKKYGSTICLSIPSNLNLDINKFKKPPPLTTARPENFDEKSALINKISQLKSNIFNDPEKDFLNKTAIIHYKEKEVNVAPIKMVKKPKQSSMNSSFDWRDSANESWMSRYYKDLSKLTARERRINEMHGSMDGDLILSNVNQSLPVYDKIEKIEQTKKFYDGMPPSQVRRQIDNISALTENEFMDNSYKCSNSENKEIIHSYQIDNIQEKDILFVKKCFNKNGIHVFDASIKDTSITGDKPGKVTMKIRENVNDSKFKENLQKATNQLKKEKGFKVSQELKNNKKTKNLNSLPKNLKWNDVHLNSYTKNRYESSNNSKTHLKALTSQNSKLTIIPYDNKYKNKILNYK